MAMTRDEERQRCAERIDQAAKAMHDANHEFGAKDVELANARTRDHVVRQQTPNDQGALQKSLEHGQKVRREWEEAKARLDAARQEFQDAHQAQSDTIARHLQEDQAKTVDRF
jgi:cellobiose-specific phosphotransferase system component IIA